MRRYFAERRGNFTRDNSTLNVGPLPYGSLFGTGSLIASEKAALQFLATTLTMDSKLAGASSSLRPWSRLLSQPALDPCRDRVIGFWCEKSRLITIQIGLPWGIQGTLDARAWGAFTELTHVDLTSSGLTGSVPPEFCTLTKLRMLALDTNSLTALPGCIGNMTQLQGLSLAANSISWIR